MHKQKLFRLQKLLLGVALGALLLALGTTATPQKKPTACTQLRETLATVLSFGKLAGAIELREAMIVTGLASPERAWEAYRAYQSSIKAALERTHQDPEYQKEKRESQAEEAAALKTFGCLPSPGTSAAPQKKPSPCEQLDTTLITVRSFGDRVGTIELREAMIVSGLASPARAGEIYRAYRGSVRGLQRRKHKDAKYRKAWREWKAAKAAAYKAFGCPNPY